MTKDEIILMARKAGLPDPMVFAGACERFAALVAAAEREACAKACLAVGTNGEGVAGEIWAERCAKAVLARREA